MKKILILKTFLLLASWAWGQVYPTPTYRHKDMANLELLSVQITDKYTIIRLHHFNPYEFGGYACVEPNTYIKVTKTQEVYRLLKVEGMPLCPERRNYDKLGENQRFTLYFPPINPSFNQFDLIEQMGNSKAFNIYAIQLTPIAKH